MRSARDLISVLKNAAISTKTKMPKKYTEPELSRAILMIVDEGMPIAKVAERTGINYRALYRYRDRYINGKQPPKQKKKNDEVAVFKKEPAFSDAEVRNKLDTAVIARARFLDDLIETKQILLERIAKLSEKSQNLDALQKSLKTLNDIEQEALPEGDAPSAQVGTVNMFQFFNQKLKNEGYEGPELTDADIVKGD